MDDFVECPICSCKYSISIIERHVNLCINFCDKKIDGSSPSSVSPVVSVKQETKRQSSLSLFLGIKEPQKIIPPEPVKEITKGRFERIKSTVLPAVKRVVNTNFIVDGFQWGPQSWCTGWFLTHFHSDHYQGLGRWFEGRLYCSRTTANLVVQQLRVDPQYIHILELEVEYEIDGLVVTALDANHCPGSVMLVIRNPKYGNQSILHTGDCRASDKLIQSLDENAFYDYIYLDTTYVDPKYCFPPQHVVIEDCIQVIEKLISKDRHRLAPMRRLILVGTYLIGKERIAIAVSNRIGIRLSCFKKEKWKILKCMDWPELQNCLSKEPTNLQLCPLGMITKEGLVEVLKDYDQVIGVKPTGWTFTDASKNSTKTVKTREYENGRLVIVDVPYSEHSSFSELQSLLEALNFDKIIPTVENYQGLSYSLSAHGNSPRNLLLGL